MTSRVRRALGARSLTTAATTATLRRGTRADRSGETGQALVLFTIFLTVILGVVALVLDQGLLRKANLDLQNSLDAGALAGVALLPGDPDGAEKTARRFVTLNDTVDVQGDEIDISFRCLIGVEDGLPRLSDVPEVCDPGPDASWVVDGTRAFSLCVPADGDVCNVIVVAGPADVDFNFAPALGVPEGSTGTKSSAACKGLCGEPPEVPIDLVIILDRTNSMNGVDTDNARKAADSVRSEYDPRVQWMGLGLLHRSTDSGSCRTTADNSNPWTATAPGDLRRWVPVGLTGKGASFETDYTVGSSSMAQGITCFNNSSGQGTDIADPVRMATYELLTYGRSEAVKAILLLSDGKPNNSSNASVKATKNYCAEAYDAASAAKAKDIELFAVGFGLDVESNHICQDTYGAWVNRSAPDLLAAMATDSKNDGCPANENVDGDHYFCLPKTSGASTDLSEVFKRAVEQLSAHSRLIKVPQQS